MKIYFCNRKYLVTILIAFQVTFFPYFWPIITALKFSHIIWERIPMFLQNFQQKFHELSIFEFFFRRVMNLGTHPLGARLYTRCTAIFERNLKYFHQLCKTLVVTVSHQILVVNSGFLIHNRWRTTKQTKNSKCRKTCYVFDVSVRPNQNPFSKFT